MSAKKRSKEKEPAKQNGSARVRLRRRILLALAATAVVAGGALALPSRSEASKPVVTVYKSPYCGCCGKWVDHMKRSGFEVKVEEVADPNVLKKQWGVPSSLLSCHVSKVGGYLLEGHVPAGEVDRLLSEQPKVAGLAVPGMPKSAPGMDAGFDNYDVVAFRTDGSTYVFARK